MSRLTLLVALPFFAACAHQGTAKLFPAEQTFHFEALRALGFAPFKGADPGEVLQTISRIREGDEESWFEAWNSTAARLEQTATASTYDRVGRGRTLLRVHNYFRTAEFFLRPDDPRKAEMYRKSVSAFYAAMNELEVPHERFDVPWGSGTLPALFFESPRATPETPLLVVVNGYDSIKEEIYFFLVEPALERGYSVLVYDGPGQGAALREQGLHFTPAWEEVNRAVLDSHFARHPLRPVVLVGCSLGSVLATRAAAHDDRVKGLVAWDIFYDFAEAVSYRMPGWVRSSIYESREESAFLRLGTSLGTRFSLQKRWALNHGRWVLGIDDPLAVLREYARYTTKDVSPDVRADVLLLAGENDHFVPLELLEKTRAALVNAHSVEVEVFSAETGAQEHCQVGAMNLVHHRLFEWLGDESHRPWQRRREAL
ncbi:MAG: alpha/beta fold hydrolase [Myxococcaceae bacterium]|nr:alpha/beta fold hydrolase [Myxococcaceae bacterium]